MNYKQHLELTIKDCLITNDYVFFWKSIFSQWHKSTFKDNKITYISCEQYMMYQKAMLFNDTEVANKILSVSSQKEIKDLGRQVKNFNPYIWGQHKISIVTKGNYLKFSQNEELKTILLSTSLDNPNRLLVEASPEDKIWGIGLIQTDPDVHDITKWQGQNLLGQCLTNVRNLLS